MLASPEVLSLGANDLLLGAAVDGHGGRLVVRRDPPRGSAGLEISNPVEVEVSNNSQVMFFLHFAFPPTHPSRNNIILQIVHSQNMQTPRVETQ